jgi:hypothetical protein
MAFGVTVGDATSTPAEAAATMPPIRIVLMPGPPPPAAAVSATPTTNSRRVHHHAPVPVPAPAPAPAPAYVAPAPVAAPAETATPEPTPTPEPTATPTPDPAQPAVKHVFLVWLAGHGQAETYGPDSPATYLNHTLRPQGTLLELYKDLGKGAAANGAALVSGKTSARVDDGRQSIADTLANAGLEARAYQGDSCDTASPRNPLGPFHGECRPLDQFATDLADAETTSALSLIVPGDCDAGVDGTCPAGEPDGLARSDAFLAGVAPTILASSAYGDGGLLLVVFDSGDGALAVSPFAGSPAITLDRYTPYSLHRTIADIFGVAPLGHAADPGVAPFATDVWPAP